MMLVECGLKFFRQCGGNYAITKQLLIFEGG